MSPSASYIKYIYISLLIVGTVMLFIRYLYSIPDYPDGRKIRISTKVGSEPVIYDNLQKLSLKGIKVYLPTNPEVHYGDKIVVDGIYRDGELRSPKIITLEESKGILYKFRQQFIDFYKASIPEPHASLVAGVTIGSKYRMPQEFWEKLKNTGTAHIVVASGMNVVLVSNFIVGFLVLFMSRKKAVPIALVIMYNYANLCGFDAPIVRAVIMTTFTLVATMVGRAAVTWLTLGVTVFIMLMIFPLWLRDVGFLLTFASTASIIYFEPILDKIFKVIPGVIRKDFTTTLAAQIGVTPIILFFFGKFNILAPIINTLVLWTIVPIAAIGALAGIIGVYVQEVGRVILYLVYPLTFYFNLVINIF